MPNNLVSLAEAAALVNDGDQIALVGSMYTTPMAFIRELIRREVKDLRIVATPIAGVNADILIGADAVKSVEFAQVAFGEYGLAPNFRRYVESGRLVTLDHT